MYKHQVNTIFGTRSSHPVDPGTLQLGRQPGLRHTTQISAGHVHPCSDRPPNQSTAMSGGRSNIPNTWEEAAGEIKENPVIQGIDKQIHEYAEEVRRRNLPLPTQEFHQDDDDDIVPYDPNLICPGCGKQYRVGEIQKLKRHIDEFCLALQHNQELSPSPIDNVQEHCCLVLCAFYMFYYVVCCTVRLSTTENWPHCIIVYN